jgi:hypothetical protein
MLSKSRVMAGRQCHKLLWWMVHEPGASELQLDDLGTAVMEQGTVVGELARTVAELRKARNSGQVECGILDLNSGRDRRTDRGSGEGLREACPSPKRRRTPLRGEPDLARITAHAD